MFKKTSLFLSILLFATLSAGPAMSDDLESNVIALFDFSNSYFTADRLKKDIPNNMRQFASAVGDKKNGPKAPAVIQVLPINDRSEVSRPICEYKLLRKKLLGGKKKKCGDFEEEYCSAKTSELKEYIRDECSQIIASEPGVNATDISGALALTSQLIDGQRADDFYVMIFSDMFEFRHKELPVSKIDLQGAKVLVICGGFYNNETDVMKLCYGTQDEWRTSLEKLGASSVEFTTENVRWSSGIAKDFF